MSPCRTSASYSAGNSSKRNQDSTELTGFAERLVAQGMAFEIEPTVRFEGEVGEQATMFFRDPAGNALEFKAFRDPERLFAK